MSSSEIAKLESRWRENPQGLTFAPLAEAYRKMRNIPRALEILGEGLGRHPDYIPASIVLGRCHLDLGDDAQAEAAFARVLELDDENVIALKALAEIAERQGRLDEAGTRLLALLTIDRSNDEARIQLARVEELRASGGAVRTPESERETPVDASAAAPSAGDGHEGGPETTDAIRPSWTGADHVPTGDEFERESEPPDVAPELLADLEDNLHPVGDVEQLPDLVPDDAPALSDAAAEAPKMPGLVGEDFHEHSAGVTPLEDLAPGTASIQPIDELPGADDILLEPSATNEFQIVSASDDWDTSATAASGAEYQLGSAADELAASARDAAGRDLAMPASLEFERTPADAFGADASLDDVDDRALAAETDAAFSADIPEEAFASSEDDFASVRVEARGGPGSEAAALEPDDVAADFEEAVSIEPPVEFAPAALADEPASADEAEPAVVDSLGEERTRFDGDETDEEALDSDLIVTESMAELFLRQGHRAEALRVYRQLYRRNRDDLGLREKVDELETALAAEESTPPIAARYRATDASRTVSAFLGSILDARPADPPSGWTEAPAARPMDAEAAPAAQPGDAAPTRPASDHLSLSAVFGEEGSPVPPASPGATVPGDDGISFDAFFGGDQTGGAPRARTASREDDDLDQFHAWLQNLKR
jgi:tetratricopeptide (TPR) repeat protein